MSGARKILFVNSWSTAHGGSSTSLIDVVTNLDSTRYEPIVMCPEEGDLPARLREAGIRVVVRGMHRFTREELHRFLLEVPQQAFWLRREHVALIHGNTSASRRSIVQASVLAGVPYIQHVRNVVRDPKPGYGFRVAQRIVCNSVATGEVFQADASLAHKTITVYNAVDLSRYEDTDNRRSELGVGGAARIIGFVGQIVPRKGVTTLIAAMSEIVRRIPNAVLVIVGCAPPDETAYEAECRTLVATLGLEAQVRFVGYKRDIPAWMRTFDVFALPTRSEPFGKVVIEAMAARCPVVASRVGGIPEIITDPSLGALINPDDPTGLATAVTSYLTDETRRSAVAERGAASARERFGMERMLARLQEVYDEVIEGRPSEGHAPSRPRAGAEEPVA